VLATGENCDSIAEVNFNPGTKLSYLPINVIKGRRDICLPSKTSHDFVVKQF
jgi:hypothetical protein